MIARQHPGRVVRGAAAILALAAPISASAASVWTVVAHGKTEPRGQEPVGYVARSRAATVAWAGRLASADRTAVRGLAFSRKAAVAVFLDGFPCASGLRVTRFSADGRRIFVSFRKAPIGIATCIRQSISYVVVALPKAALQGNPTARIAVVAHARA